MGVDGVPRAALAMRVWPEDMPTTERILEVLRGWDGPAPSWRELMRLVGRPSLGTVSRALEKLRLHGYVDWQDGQTRTLHLTP